LEYYSKHYYKEGIMEMPENNSKYQAMLEELSSEYPMLEEQVMDLQAGLDEIMMDDPEEEISFDDIPDDLDLDLDEEVEDNLEM
jgi:hypothetical protein